MPCEGFACFRKALVLVGVVRLGLECFGGWGGLEVGVTVCVGVGEAMAGVGRLLVVAGEAVRLGVGLKLAFAGPTGGCLFGTLRFMIAGAVGGLAGVRG